MASHRITEKKEETTEFTKVSLCSNNTTTPTPPPTITNPTTSANTTSFSSTKTKSSLTLTKRELSSTLSSSSSVDLVVERERKVVNRCFCCRKKVGLTGFRCRCGELFCGEHRYSDRHECGFDYKAAGREAIARENPVVKAAKIVRL